MTVWSLAALRPTVKEADTVPLLPSVTVASPTESAGFATVQSRSPGLASTFPAGSTAATRKLWPPRPAVSPCGEVHGANASPSRLHLKVAVESLLENLKVAPRRVTVPLGPPSIVPAGATVSIVQSNVAGGSSVLPAVSVARTAKLRGPSARPVYAWGEVHAVQAPESRRHW